MTDDIYLIALCSIPVLGPVNQRRLIRTFGTPEAVFSASLNDLSAVEGIGQKRAVEIKKFKEWSTLQKDIERIKADGVKLLKSESGQYPEGLKVLGEHAPLVIYMKGDIIEEDRFSIAIVGSRMPTSYGLAVTEKLAGNLAEMGFTVVSGLARGIDTTAHVGSLKRGGRSIAVLGSGIDVPYPAENKGLMERMAHSGAVISEYPLGTPPLKENFPRRNRLISGLSMGVLVAEAAAKSGALITARCALDQNREVFAVPGNINSPFSEGTNMLIKDGARVVTSADDIVEELASQLKGFIKKSKKMEKIFVSDEEKALCDIMEREPVHVDVISRQSGLTPHKALAVLLGLELKGIVKQIEGKQFYLQ
jgi:DNA processing protein